VTPARDTPRPRRGARARLVLAALLAVGAVAAGGRDLLRWWVRRDHVVGIDVSHHQGAIDWTRVRAGGIGFAFIKATEGATFVDRTFAGHWSRARAAGLLRGAYHFFTFCTPGRDQAANFIATVPVDDGALPPVVDLEFGGNCAREPAPAELRAQLGDFVRAVEAHYGKRVIFYVTEEFEGAYGELVRDRDLFVRRLFLPRQMEGRRWRFWQFDNGARVDGIERPTDLDAFRGGPGDLRALARRP